MTAITQLSGSSGNSLIDAMLATFENQSVPVADRPTTAGTTFAKWGDALGTGVTLTYSFSDASSTFSSDYGAVANDVRTLSDAAKDAFRTALGQWATVADVRFQEVMETSTTWGDLRFFVSGSNPNQPADTGGAEASVPASFGAFGGSGADLIGDIVLTPAAIAQWDYSVGGSGYRTVLHEIGHAVFNLTDVSTNAGLGGEILPRSLNFTTRTIESYSVAPGATAGDNLTSTLGGQAAYPTAPMVLDVSAAQYLYGINASHNAGDDLYDFSEGQVYLQTIWDAGGTDTIRYNAASDGSLIDLRPGAYSELGEALPVSPASGSTTVAATVGIANGAVIENARGGNGADTIIGNDAANTLFGRNGADALSGGLGADILYGNIDSDILYGNRDDDTLYGGQERDSLLGGQGDDAIYGNRATDTLYGGTGNDSLYGGQEDDALFGGGGNDTLQGGRGDDILFGLDGNDRLLGGVGNDTLYAGNGDDTAFGGAGADTFVLPSLAHISMGFGWGDLSADDRIDLNDKTVSSIEQSGSGSIVHLSPGGFLTIQDFFPDQIQFDSAFIWFG